MALPKFPRRYAQRQTLALRHGRATTSQPSKARSRKKQRQAVAPDNRTSTSDSDSGSKPLLDDGSSDDGSDSDCGSDQDSGYSSSSSPDVKAEYYRQMRVQFAAEGPIMAELSDASKAMVRTEKEKWNE